MFWLRDPALPVPGWHTATCWEGSNRLVPGNCPVTVGGAYLVQSPSSGGRTSRLSVQTAWKSGI
jgi:hypothetical protein